MDLQTSVREAIDAFVQSKRETHTATDVLRVIRDNSMLLFEQQVLCDTLHADPMQQLDGVQPQVKRIQDLMDVVSCSRTQTLDGFSSICAVVDWKRDEKMPHVEDHVQLTFSYERRHASMEQPHQTETHVTYLIEVAKDHGPRERLLTVEVWASGAGPSADAPVPLEMDEDGEWEDMSDDHDETSGVEMKDGAAPLPTCSNGTNNGEQHDGQADRYAAYLDPDVLSNLLTWSHLSMDETTAFFFLMTFPFYEHEWDLVGCVLDACFGEEAMEEDEEAEENHGDSDQ